MKKLLSTILVLAFVLAALSALTPMASAKSATISEREVKELVEKAGQLFRARVGGYNNKYFDTNSDERKTVHFPEYNIDVTYRPSSNPRSRAVRMRLCAHLPTRYIPKI